MKIKDILKTKNDWTQGSYARNKDNIDTGSRSPTAVRFCLLGAYHQAYLLSRPIEERLEILIKIQDYLDKHYGTRDVCEWNDARDRDFKEVKDMINILDI